MRIVTTCLLVSLWAGGGSAQPGATGPVATLNVEAKGFSEAEPERSLAAALKARTETDLRVM